MGPYKWSTTPALPAALTINSTTGVISGNLTAALGNYTVAVMVKDKGNQTASRNCTIIVQEADPFAWVTPETLPSGKAGVAYSQNLTVSGGRAPYTYVTKNGSTLPVGLTLNATTRRISGTPTASGSFSFTITARDAASPANTLDRTFTLAIESYGMIVNGTSTISGKQYTAITPAPFTVSGGMGPYKWSTTPALPAALTINATTGVISGNLTAALGNYTVAVTVKDKGNQTASRNCTITVQEADPFAWVTDSVLPGGKAGTSYSQNLTVSGGKPPYTFATKNGSTLPAGLTLNATTRRISGTPTASGNFSFTITARDSASPANTLDRTFTLSIESYGMSVNGTSAISGKQYTAITPAPFTVSGGVAPYTWSTTPALPAALTINATTGMISGNLTAAPGNYTVAVMVKDKGNQTASRNCTITVQEADPFAWVTPETLPGGKVATAYSQNLTVSGGKSPYSFATKNGSTLPAGLTLNATTRRISGTPTASGNFSFTITAKDSGSPATTIERTFTLAIQAYGMSVSGPTAISGQQYNAIPPATYSVSGGVAPYSWSTVPALPAALSINSTTGVISGNLSAAGGNYSVAVTVKDKGNQTVSQNVTFTVASAPTLEWVTQSPLPTGKVASAYTTNLTLSGGRPNYTYALKNGSTLPPGLTLNTTTGVISGTPTTASAASNSSAGVIVTTLAGSGTAAFADGQGTAASFSAPSKIAVDKIGNIYVSDSWNNKIRKITPSGIVTTIAGSGSFGFSDGQGALARFANPNGVAVADSGNIYVADSYNNRIRKITPDGNVTTLAGSGDTGASGMAFSDGLGAAARFAYPIDLYVDKNENIYVADMFNGRIRKITPNGNVITLTSGLYYPKGVVLDQIGNIYVAEEGNSRILKITSDSNVTTLAGSGNFGFADGQGTAASFKYPVGIALDQSGNFYVADNENHRIRKINSSGNVTTLAGSGTEGFADGNGALANFDTPYGVAVNGSGNIYVADFGNNRIRKISQASSGNTFTIIARDSANPQNTAEHEFTLVVEPYGMSVNGPTTISGQQYSAIALTSFTPVGGTANYTWSVNSTTGLTINATTGNLSGILTAAPGNYSMLVSVRDGRNQTVSQNVTISVSHAPPLDWVTQSALPGGKVATTYNATLTVSGGKSLYSFVTKNGSTLPGGLTLNATTGLLSGAPTAAGNFSFTITAKDSASPATTIERTFTLSIAPYGMAITDNSPSEITGKQFNPLPPAAFSVTGGRPAYAWSSTPTPPTGGLTLNATTGILSGVPTTAGNTTISVRVTDGANQTVTKNCTIRILPAGNLTITTASPLPSATVNTSYSTTLAASGGKPFLTANQSTYYNWTIANRGNLPTNFTLNATTGILSGTANAVLTANFTVRVTDAANVFATKNCSLQITAPLDTGDADGDGVNNYREAYDGTDPFDPKSFNPLSVGLVAHYPFEGNAKDESGYKKDGVVKGAVLTTDQFGSQENAYEFNGTNSAIEVPDSESIRPQKQITVSAWVNIDNLQPYKRILTKGVNINDSYGSYQLITGSNLNDHFHDEPLFTIQTTNGYRVPNPERGQPVQKWIHVCGTYDGQKTKLFYGGQLVAEVQSSGDLRYDSNPLVIGRDLFWNTSFDGKIDEVRIYNRALTAAEVSQLYSEESGEPNMILVQGGTLPAGSALANQTVSAFHIARFETTWAEWKQVRTWAVANGYTDLANVGQGSADNHPVRNVSWYDTVKWLNAKSQMEGLMPVYYVNGTTYKTGQSIPTLLATANGYRLPAEAEWEWAARGGVSSKGYTYSGSNDANAVAWYDQNSGNGTKAIGAKAPNELGIYDMSGNVWEWCEDLVFSFRRVRGGSWAFQSVYTAVVYNGITAGVDDRYSDRVGFRYARNAIGDMVTVQGGTLPQSSQLSGQKVQAFQICRTEVTWGEWKAVRVWAAANGYSDLATVGEGSADNHPVRNVNWYDAVKWSNAKSQMEGLAPVYSLNGTTYKTGQGEPSIAYAANGYRLPVEAEWEWAARGGINSQGYSYSGSNDLNLVGWYLNNSEGGTRPVANKKPNELGVFDMTGNVREMTMSNIRGGDFSIWNPALLSINQQFSITLNQRDASTGFRLARNIGPKISIIGTLPEATLNQAYAGYTFGAVGSTGDKAWSISEGALPPGMSFSANGTLSGTPTSAGIYTFVIRLESGGYSDELDVELAVED
jgi:formylglycine-generating enzyme required for sulfatase activity